MGLPFTGMSIRQYSGGAYTWHYCSNRGPKVIFVCVASPALPPATRYPCTGVGWMCVCVCVCVRGFIQLRSRTAPAHVSCWARFEPQSRQCLARLVCVRPLLEKWRTP